MTKNNRVHKGYSHKQTFLNHLEKHPHGGNPNKASSNIKRLRKDAIAKTRANRREMRA